MASFRPDGKLYDGHGVQPDVPVEMKPEDFLGGDSLLLAAHQHQLKMRLRRDEP